MHAFVVLGLVFHTKPRDWLDSSQEIGLGNVSEMTYFCVEWDIKP